MKDMTFTVELAKILSQNNSSVNPNPNAGLGFFDISEKQFIPIQTSSFSIST